MTQRAITVVAGRLLVFVLALLIAPTAGFSQPVLALPAPAFSAPEPVLRSYIEEALGRNTQVRAAAAQYRASLQEVPRVRALPDPMVSFTQALRSVETRVGPQRHTLMLSQAFPWFGTLALREQVALQTAAGRYHQYVARQRDVIASVKEVFYNLGYIDRALAITREEAVLLEKYEALAQARFAAGQGLQQGVLRLQAELTRVLTRLQTLDQQRGTLAARLNTLRDRPPEDQVAAVDAPSLPTARLDLDALYALGDRHRPELHAGTAAIERSERSIALAEKAFYPHVTVGVGYQLMAGRTDPAGRQMPPPDNGKNPVTASLSLTLPLWREKYQAGVEQAREDLLAERERYATARNDMEFAVRDAALRLQTLREQIDLVEHVLIPQAEETLSASEAAYETGQVNVLDLLDGERMRLDVRLVSLRYRADYLIALAQLERAIGTTVPQQ